MTSQFSQDMATAEHIRELLDLLDRRPAPYPTAAAEARRVLNLSIPLAETMYHGYVTRLSDQGREDLRETLAVLKTLAAMDDTEIAAAPIGALVSHAADLAEYAATGRCNACYWSYAADDARHVHAEPKESLMTQETETAETQFDRLAADKRERRLSDRQRAAFNIAEQNADDTSVTEGFATFSDRWYELVVRGYESALEWLTDRDIKDWSF